MMTKEQIQNLYNTDPHFKRMASVWYTLRDDHTQLRNAVTLLYLHDINVAEITDVVIKYGHRREAYEKMLEDIYGITWQDFEMIIKVGGYNR